MNAQNRTAITTLSAAVMAIIIAPAAMACGPAEPGAPLTMQQLRMNAQNPLESITSESLGHDMRSESKGEGASIVGMWSFQFISEGNTTHNPSIPDGAILDFGYSQWHSDGTEVLNSGGRSPAQGNFCLGVWEKTGHSTYQLNHFALNYDAATGAFLGKLSVVETVTLSPGGTRYSGRFVYTVFDTKGNKIDGFTGQVNAQRITVDTATP